MPTQVAIVDAVAGAGVISTIALGAEWAAVAGMWNLVRVPVVRGRWDRIRGRGVSAR